MGVNKQIIIGNLGKDPEARQGQDGGLVCRFSVAVTENAYTTQSGMQVPEHTEWFNIRCTGKKADVARQYLHKGDKVYIEGKTFTGEYVNQNGAKSTYTEVRCEVLELLTPKGQSQGQQQVMPQQGFVPQGAPQYQQTPQYQQQQLPPAPQQFPQAQAPVGVFGQPAQAAPAAPQWPG